MLCIEKHCRVIPVHVGLLQHVNVITTLVNVLSFLSLFVLIPFYLPSILCLPSYLTFCLIYCIFSHLSLSLSVGTRLPVKGPATGAVIGGLIGLVLLLAIIGSVVVLVRKKRSQHNGE